MDPERLRRLMMLIDPNSVVRKGEVPRGMAPPDPSRYALDPNSVVREDEGMLGVGAEVGASMLPGVGTAIDLNDVASGVRKGELGRAGWGLAALAVPGVGGRALKRGAQGIGRGIKKLLGNESTGQVGAEAMNFMRRIQGPLPEGKDWSDAGRKAAAERYAQERAAEAAQKNVARGLPWDAAPGPEDLSSFNRSLLAGGDPMDDRLGFLTKVYRDVGARRGDRLMESMFPNHVRKPGWR